MGRFVGHPFGMVLSALFDDDTQDVPHYLHGKRVCHFVGGLFGTVLCALFDDDMQDVPLFTR